MRALSTLLALMLLSLPACCHTRAVPEAAFRWAERQLRQAAAFPSNLYDCDQGAESAAQAFRSIISKYGPTPRAYVGIARSQALAGDYSGAVRNCRAALALSPKSVSVERELRIAKENEYVAARAAALLEKRSIIRVVRYRVDTRQRLWLVLASRKSFDTDRQIDIHSDVCLALLDMNPRNPSVVWRSRALGPGYTRGRFDYLQLYLLDLTGDKIPEALVTETQVGAWWNPSHLDVFAFKASGVSHLLGVSSEEPPTIADLNGDGRYEVRNYRFIGTTMCHGEDPLWFDVHAYKDGTYQLANGDFPHQYRKLAGEMRKQLALHPDDRELRHYLGRLRKFQRHI